MVDLWLDSQNASVIVFRQTSSLLFEKNTINVKLSQQRVSEDRYGSKNFR